MPKMRQDRAKICYQKLIIKLGIFTASVLSPNRSNSNSAGIDYIDRLQCGTVGGKMREGGRKEFKIDCCLL